MGSISKRDEPPLQPILEVELFDMGNGFHGSFSFIFQQPIDPLGRRLHFEMGGGHTYPN